MYNDFKALRKGVNKMDIELVIRLQGRKQKRWTELLTCTGLEPDANVDTTVLIWDGEILAATGSRKGNLLKCIAVNPEYQGQDLTATVLTQLRQDALNDGHRHLFLYTKPQNKLQFSSLFFYPVAQTENVLLMENKPRGIETFLEGLKPANTAGSIGALVMNCNPFTLGHRHVIETAARECDHVYVFVLSEEQPPFPAADRLELVKKGTEDLSNVTVFPTGPYLISSATFPTYFLKDRDQVVTAQCGLDIAIFSRYYIPKFGITHRYVGTEPTSPLTNTYNQALKASLPIPVKEIPRLESESIPISASTVRSLLADGQWESLRKLVPPTTFDYLQHI